MDCLYKYSYDEFKNIFSSIPVSAAVYNTERILFINDYFLNLLGFDKDEQDIHEEWVLLVNDDKFHMKEEIENFINGTGKENKVDKQFYNKKKEHVYLDYTYNVIEVDGEKYLFSVFNNITREKEQEEKLSKMLDLRESMLNLTQKILDYQPIQNIYEIILGTALKCIDNAKLGSIMLLKGDCFEAVACTGFDKSKIIGVKIPKEIAFIYRLTDGRIDRTVIMNDLLKLEGGYYAPTSIENEFLKSTMSTPIYIEGKLFGILNIDSIKTDQFDYDDKITMDFLRTNIEIGIDRHIALQNKVYFSKHDGLTDLYNRSYFEEKLMNYFLENKICKNSYLAIMDLDNLKIVNDNFGHIMGDLMITRFADELKKAVGKSDLVGRYGGDEFIGLFIRKEYDDVVNLMENIRHNLLENPIIFQENEIPISFSYGISHKDSRDVDYRELVRNADEKMYEYKKENKKMQTETIKSKI